MALFPKTPGVYIQEIQTLPASVAAVPTAIPVFIGYTEMGDTDTPTRVTSLLEYQQIFGGPFSELFDVTLTTADVDIAVALTNPSDPQFRLFYQLQMYFANGGGPCYIISVDDYSASAISGADLLAGIEFAEQVDEITLVVVPEAMSSDIDDNERRDIYNEMLAHCAKMQDRFSILDVEVRGGSIFDDGADFRDLNVGANNLKYGAAYYPSLETGLSFAYADTDVTLDASDVTLPSNVQAYDGETLDALPLGLPATGTLSFTSPSITQTYVGNLTIAGAPVIDLSDYDLDPDAPETFTDFVNNDPVLSLIVSATQSGNDVIITSLQTGAASNLIVFSLAAIPAPSNVSVAPTGGTLTGGANPDTLLYNRITTSLQTFPLPLYPSATMAGVYAAVDNARGVWKAPANVSVNMVDSLGAVVDDAEQADLNVDASSGKSINVIRNFIGRGTLVWGARTLAGNDNEWRYVSVRRLFIFAEDSIRKASEFVVFEPNDKNTWVRTKSMISNFLTDLWRQGALTGDKPEQAYFVKVGLNETMTAQDILEGKLIIEVGLAAVRPAEFIILKFMHKMQEA
jgi:phage tail sheath protein FI